MGNAVRQLSMAWIMALALVVFGAAPAFAQIGQAPQQQAQPDADEYEGFGIGVKGGWLFTNFDQEGIAFDRRAGYQVGLWFGGNRSGVVGVMAEVNYGKKGAEIQNVGDYDVTFVGVPVLLRINVGQRSRNTGINAYGVIGPELDWLINHSLLGVDLEEDTEGFELGLVIGGGIEISRFLAELRYIHGLRSISSTFDLTETTDLKTKSFAILFGVRFN